MSGHREDLVVEGLPAARLPVEVAALLQRLRRLAPLSPAETELVAELARQPWRQAPPRRELQAEGALPPPFVLLSGWACRLRILTDGRRQIIGFLLPGDVVGRPPPQLPALCAVAALTRVQFAEAASLFAGPAEGGLARALRAMELQDLLRLQDQVVRLGRQTAYERLASLLLELQDRLADAGLVRDGLFPLPLTQEVLGDALGLSIVHVNRTLQQMRRDGLVEVKGGMVALLQDAALRGLADWQPPPTGA